MPIDRTSSRRPRQRDWTALIQALVRSGMVEIVDGGKRSGQSGAVRCQDVLGGIIHDYYRTAAYHTPLLRLSFRTIQADDEQYRGCDLPDHQRQQDLEGGLSDGIVLQHTLVA
ncbi:MAG: hypothetical protein NVSMB42_25070 [Herpetosiphon sp.]